MFISFINCKFAIKLLIGMTKNITIKKPSPELISFINGLKEKKDRQIKKLTEKDQCTFTIIV